MLTYFINRGGRGLSPERSAVLAKANELLSRKIRGEKDTKRSRKKRALLDPGLEAKPCR